MLRINIVQVFSSVLPFNKSRFWEKISTGNIKNVTKNTKNIAKRIYQADYKFYLVDLRNLCSPLYLFYSVIEDSLFWIPIFISPKAKSESFISCYLKFPWFS